MKVKKFYIAVFIFTLILIITGCNDGGQNESTDGNSSDPGTSAVESETSDVETDDGTPPEKMEVSVATNGILGAELPDGYPQDKFPLYEKSYISTALKQDDSFTVIAFSEDEAAKVTEYYAGVLKDAAVIAEGETDGHFTSFGTISGYSYQIDIGESDEMEGYKTSVTIVLMPKM